MTIYLMRKLTLSIALNRVGSFDYMSLLTAEYFQHRQKFKDTLCGRHRIAGFLSIDQRCKFVRSLAETLAP